MNSTTKFEKDLYESFFSSIRFKEKIDELHENMKIGIENRENFIKSGTTIILIKYKDGYLIGADRKSTEGQITYSLDEDKIYTIGEKFVLAATGLIAEINLVLKILKSFRFWYINKYKKEPSSDELANLIFWISPHLWFSEYLACGIVNLYGKNTVAGYDISLLYKRFVGNYAANGSGAFLGGARSVLEADYRDNMSREEALNLMLKALKVAERLDHYSGVRSYEDFQVFDVTINGIKQIQLKENVR